MMDKNRKFIPIRRWAAREYNFNCRLNRIHKITQENIDFGKKKEKKQRCINILVHEN